MRYQLLGRSGLRVSEACLGTMNFGQPGWGIDTAAARALFDLFAEAGGTFIDTAHIYGNGESERIVGDLVRADRDHFVIATKYTPSHGGDISRSGNSRKAMMQMVDGSLRRLGTDFIDLFYIHMWDFTTSIEEVMRGLEDLVRMGKVLYVGASNLPAWQIARANMLADLRGWAPFVGIQIKYSLAERTSERDLLPMARELDLGVLAWAPLAGGALVSKSGPRDRLRESSPRMAALAAITADIASELCRPPAQIALAALRRLGHADAVIPILGASSPAQLADNLAGLALSLPVEHLERLEQASAIEPGYPHDFLAQPVVRALMTGGHDDRLNNHRRGLT